jgi:hypothetical protein
MRLNRRPKSDEGSDEDSLIRSVLMKGARPGYSLQLLPIRRYNTSENRAKNVSRLSVNRTPRARLEMRMVPP